MAIWPQHYTPVSGSLALSALVASLPILVVLLMLGVWRRPAWQAGVMGLAAAVLVALGVYRMPMLAMLGAVSYGAAFGLFPISWVLFWAIVLYRLTLETGQFEILKESIGAVTADRRLQALLIAFVFGAFLEGAAGFGAPVAVTAAMLTGLGFSRFYAAGLCLLANTAPVAFGSIGIPVLTLALVTGLPVRPLSAWVGRICAPVSLVIPAYLVLVMGGWPALKGVLPAALICGLSFAATQFLVSNFIGPQLTDLLGSLAAIASLLALFRVWRPKDRFSLAEDLCVPAPAEQSATACAEARPAAAPGTREEGMEPSGTAGEVAALQPRIHLAGTETTKGADAAAVAAAVGQSRWGLTRNDQGSRRVWVAWLPYLLLVLFVFAWGRDEVKRPLDRVTVKFAWPGLHKAVEREPPVAATPTSYEAVYTLNYLTASGTACMFAVLVTALLFGVSVRQFGRVVAASLRHLALAILTIASVLGLAFLMNYCGATATLGLAFAATGRLFPFFGALLGWAGVFLVGSDTSANALFGNLQVITAQRLGLDPVLMAAANSSGGVMGKMISLSSIAVAAAATGMPASDEARLFRFTLGHSLLLAVAIGLVVALYAWLE